MPTKFCAIEECGEELSANSRMETCPNCRSTQYRWNSRRPAQIVERRRKLALYSNRMDTFFEKEIKAKR